MDSIGAEVGQKMRSAIKAKLMELDCYVDDELPDYIMVMVANKRTKSQMNEDLNLFLNTKTTTFVNWLHIVLKKLKEVTVTNPEVYKKAAKRKSSESLPDEKNNLKIKREKHHKKVKNEHEDRDSKDQIEKDSSAKSLTDDLPVATNKFVEKRRIVIQSNTTQGPSNDEIAEDNFDIPLLSEVNESSNEKDLQEIEKKIRNVKSRLGLLVESDDDDSADVQREKDDPLKHIDEESNPLAQTRKISVVSNESNGSQFQNEAEAEPSSTTSLLSKEREVELDKERFTSDAEKSEATDNEEFEDSKEKEPKEIERPKHTRITFESDHEEYPSLTTRSRREKLKSGDGSLYDRSPKRIRNDHFRDKSRDRSPNRIRNDQFINNRSPMTKKRSVLDRLGKRLDNREKNFSGFNRTMRSDYIGVEKRPFRRSLSKELDRRHRDNSRDKRNNRSRSKSRDKSPYRNRSPSRSKDRSPNRSRNRSLRTSRDRGLNISKDKNVPSSRERIRDDKREGVLSRLGVPSKIAVIKKPKSEDEDEKVVREVQSLIKVKPRVIPSDVPQPNKNLLLKAVAEAQRSVAQTPRVGKEVKSDSLYTKTYKEKRLDFKRSPKSSEGDDRSREVRTRPRERESKNIKKRLGDGYENALKNIIKQSSRRMWSKFSDSSDEYSSDEYVPKSMHKTEKCKYWPSCRQGDKCEFVHPIEICKQFPACKFGEKCLYLHPECKFGSSCTKRECPYDHHTSSKNTSSSTLQAATSTKQTCKYFPKCSNSNCPFYHPKVCRFGKYCKNIPGCNFVHENTVISKKNLSWRSSL